MGDTGKSKRAENWVHYVSGRKMGVSEQKTEVQEHGSANDHRMFVSQGEFFK